MSQQMMTLAQSTRSVANASALLQRALAVSPVPDPLAVERLEILAEHRLGRAQTTGTQRFETTEGGAGQVHVAGVTEDEALAEVLVDLSIGNALLAAGQAVGETGTRRDDRSLVEAVSALNGVAEDLEERSRSDGVLRRGFEPVTPSADLPQAAERLARQLDATLEELAESSAGVVTDAMAAVFKLVPDKLTDLIDNLGTGLELGRHARRFTRLGLATIERALTALARLFPLGILSGARQEVATLAARLQAGDAAPAVLGWLIGVEDVRAHAAQLPRPQQTTPDRLDLAIAALRALGERYASLMKIAAGIVTAIGLVSVIVTPLGMGFPHLAAVTAGALLLVVATVVLLGMDYTDARPIPGFVPGVRSVVTEAWSAT